MRSRRKTWIFGGVGLIACGVIGMLQTTLLGMPGAEAIGVIADALYAASILLFAIGFSRSASVVERRPLGAAAMTIVALWPLASFTLTRILAARGNPRPRHPCDRARYTAEARKR